MNEVETVETEGLIWVMPKGNRKPIKISSFENILDELEKAGVIELAEPLKPEWTTEDEDRRRELVWRDLLENYGERLRFKIDIGLSKDEFLENPMGHIERSMDALIKWATDKKAEVVGFVERTMKAYGPEGERNADK